MPFIVFSHLPLLDNILPVRMSMEVDACIGVVIAFGLDDLRRAPARHTIETSRSAERG